MMKEQKEKTESEDNKEINLQDIETRKQLLDAINKNALRDTPELQKLREMYLKNFTLLKPYLIDKKYSWFSIEGIKKKWALRHKKHKLCFVRMRLLNGKTRSFIAYEDADGFYYDKGKYLYVPETKEDDIDLGMALYNFHEGFSLSIGVKLPIEEIKKIMISGRTMLNVKDIEYSTSPKLLKEWLQSSIIEAILKGNKLMEAVNFLKIMSIIQLILLGLIAVGFGYMFYKMNKNTESILTLVNQIWETLKLVTGKTA